MSSKAEKDRGKQIEDKCQALLTEMLRDEDNKYCVDCDAKGPRWASWNLGIFLCIRCAGIHRNLGVHISKVKSVNLDTWTPEQVVSLQQMGNSRARAVYEANIPDNFRRPQSDSALEAFVRAKYEHKKYIAKEWVPTPVPNVKQSWERELDEEAERLRRRKREAKQVRAVRNDVGTPQPLPKPREGASSSPRPQRAAAIAATQPRVDLFFDASPAASDPTAAANGGEDGFGGFLSAPAPASVAPAETAKAAAVAHDAGRSAEEESFFNQPAPTSQEKRQLTKDSILALYASSAPQQQPPPQQQQQPNLFGIGAGGAFPPQQQAPFGSFCQPPQASHFPQNGPFNLGPASNVPMFGAAGTQSNQFGMGGAHHGQFMQGAPNGQLQHGMPNGQFISHGSQNGPFGAQLGALGSNPFFNMGANPMGQQGFPQMSQLPQQVGRMNLGPSQPQNPTSIPGQSLANNLWQ